MNIVEVEGVDLPSGNPSKIIVEPAGEDTGVVFRTRNDVIPAGLDNVEAITFPCKTLMLHGGRDKVAVPEHVLAQLYAYGIDNAIVHVEKSPSLTSRMFKYFGSARNTYFVPEVLGDLCCALDGNFKKQEGFRRMLKLKENLCSDEGGLSMTPRGSPGLRIEVLTRYILSDGPLAQSRSLEINEESIKEISSARSYCGTVSWAPRWLTKTVASLVYLSHGFGNGNDGGNTFYPMKTRKQWKDQEVMGAELACHSIMDRLGELALLPGRLEGVYVQSFKVGHKEAISALKKYRSKFNFIKD